MTLTTRTRRASPACVLGAGLALLAVACGPGSGDGLDANGNLIRSGTNSGGGLGASGNPNATLAWLQGNVFGGVCSQCHTGAGAPMGVSWSSEASTCSNIGRVSGEKSPMLEIESGSPATSYLIWKVQGAGPAGEAIVAGRMPLNNAALSEATIKNMRDWIADGTPGC